MTIEEGSLCVCGGVFEFTYPEDMSCSCHHIMPPCPRCTSSILYCPDCLRTDQDFDEDGVAQPSSENYYRFVDITKK